jgi:hypothetical protein
MEDWFSETVAVESVAVEVCFLLSKEYEGEPLPLPAIPRVVEALVRSSELTGHEALLADYYRQIIRCAARDGKKFDEIAHFFWLRLYLWNTEAGVTISFPWYDTYAEMKPFFHGVLSGESGRVYFDGDQGWEQEVHRDGGQFYVKQWDPDDGEIHALVRFPAAALAQAIPVLMQRVEAEIAELSRLLGADVWTRRVAGEPVWAPATGGVPSAQQ